MLVSIAISTFESGGKGAEMLNYALHSIMRQTYKNIEIVISDHSKDDKIEYEIKKFPNLNIKYVRYEKNYGSNSCNTNNAINNCNGELIKILFMDDYLYSSHAIQKIVNAFEKNKNIYWLVNSYWHTYDRIRLGRLHCPKWNKNLIKGINTIGCPSNLTIRNTVKERFDENLIWLMDCEYYWRLKQKYGLPIFYNEPLNVQLLHENQLTNKGAKQRERNELKYIQEKILNHSGGIRSCSSP